MNNAGTNMYEKLTIRNKFMFGKVTQNPVIAQKMADLLTPVEIGAVTETDREKFLQHRSSSKYVKLDMYLEDENGHVVDTEMQNKSNNKMVQEELPLRIRYYQGMIDQEILSSGTDYIFLKETYIIFICTYDPFGKGKYVYHFHMTCDEDESIQLHDKMNWIFYNTTADLSNAPEGIKKFLSYVENEYAEDEFTRLIDKEVKNARLNEEWRSEYLKTYVNDMDMRREGYIEGEKLGLERGKAEGEKLGLERGKAEGEKLGEERGRAEGERERDRTLINQWLQKGKVITEIADDLGKSEEYVKSLI